jgi:hypothetical protein
MGGALRRSAWSARFGARPRREFFDEIECKASPVDSAGPNRQGIASNELTISNSFTTESLILAQDERWRRA